jgi:hypothetical protein
MLIYYSDNLIIRWTFGETLNRPTSLQAFDMLECGVAFASVLFPNARKIISYNSLKSSKSLEKLKCIAQNNVELIESTSPDFRKVVSTKNSFWKYYPKRYDINKYELILDNDVILWDLPETITNWLNSNGLLINTDWNGSYYGIYNKDIPKETKLNAGIIGYPPDFDFILPDYSELTDYFHSEQGYIVKTFMESKRELFILKDTEIFQSNNDKFNNPPDVVKIFKGGHFCGCSYCHYFHWDKIYKDLLWEKLKSI